jgi:predicted nucleotidyltransferase
LLQAVVDYFDPQRVILFGSRARGDGGEDSDIDLLVVVDDDTPAEKLSWEAVWRVRDDHAGALDLMACRSSTLERRARAIGSFAHALLREGKVVYERR